MEDLPILEIVPTEQLEEETVIVSYEDLADDSLPSNTADIFVAKPTNNKKKFDIPEKAVKKRIVRIKEPPEEPDEPEEEEVEEEAINIVIEPTEPVKKKKRPLSEKQRLHLEKARIKAIEKKKSLRLKKEEVNKRVKAEMKMSDPIPVQNDFESFLNHMTTFKSYEAMHYAEERNKKEKEEINKKQVAALISPPPKKQPVAIPKIIAQPPTNMYSSAFDW